MEVFCIDGFLPFFTYGEKYIVLDINDFFNIYEIENDLGSKVLVNSKFFKKVDVFRGKIIRDILR